MQGREAKCKPYKLGKDTCSTPYLIVECILEFYMWTYEDTYDGFPLNPFWLPNHFWNGIEDVYPF
jgi:hypothetical protein